MSDYFKRMLGPQGEEQKVPRWRTKVEDDGSVIYMSHYNMDEERKREMPSYLRQPYAATLTILQAKQLLAELPGLVAKAERLQDAKQRFNCEVKRIKSS